MCLRNGAVDMDILKKKWKYLNARLAVLRSTCVFIRRNTHGRENKNH